MRTMVKGFIVLVCFAALLAVLCAMAVGIEWLWHFTIGRVFVITLIVAFFSYVAGVFAETW